MNPYLEVPRVSVISLQAALFCPPQPSCLVYLVAQFQEDQPREAMPLVRVLLPAAPQIVWALRVVLMIISLPSNTICVPSNLVDYTKPDVWYLFRFMPPGYLSPIRLDRNKHVWGGGGGGGVLIAVRDCFSAVKVDQPDCSAEMVWAEVALRGKKKLYVGSFYRGNYDTETARAKPLDQMQKFVRHIQSLAKKSDSTIIVGGDFNLGDIDWSRQPVPPGSVNKQA